MSATHHDTLEQAERHCRDHGVKLTSKRKQVLETLLESGKAISAYDLVAQLRRQRALELPPMTVYRILDFLQKENLVHKLLSTNKYVACSHITCDHAHDVSQFLICGQCDKVKEVGVGRSIITALREQVERAQYRLQSEQLELYCLCNDCAQQAK